MKHLTPANAKAKAFVAQLAGCGGQFVDCGGQLRQRKCVFVKNGESCHGAAPIR